jgi:rod shape-determining protein MreD
VALAVGLVVLALVQVSIINFLPTPWAVPDVVVVAVLALAIAHGPLVGGLVGASAGLLLDLIPPASGPVGGWMLVLAVAGAVVGRVAGTYRPGPFAAMILLSLGAGAVVLMRSAVLWFAGSSVDATILLAAVASAAWALVLAPLALLVVTRSTGRIPRAAVRVTWAGSAAAAGGAGGAGGAGPS